MKAVETLFQFMPYGAPELLQSRRERLAAAMLASSIAIAALFLTVGGLARLIVVPAIEIPRVMFKPHDFVPQPKYALPRPDAPSPREHAPVVDAVPVPVPDPDPDVQVVQDPGTTVDAGNVGAKPSMGEPDQTYAVPGEDLLPGPKDYVRAEQLPEPVTVVKPVYPEIGLRAGVEGLVIVKVLVGKNGHVLDAQLDDKRQVPLLNEAALAAARQWRFTPALANGRPVAVWTAIPFHFLLND